MSFNNNDNTNNMIHLGNYEEFFVLYIDNELTDEQMKMVDDFLIAHPDLQSEMEILASTKLPAEKYIINKEELLSESMMLNSIDETLLLYIDDELPADKKNEIDLELLSNKNYQLQHQLLMNAKLDASEKIVYPYKKELYRKTDQKIRPFQPWLRVAAAVIIIAVMGVLYFINSGNKTEMPPEIAIKQNEVKKNVPVQKEKQEPLQNETIIADIPEQKNNVDDPIQANKKDQINEPQVLPENNEQDMLIAQNDIVLPERLQVPVQTIDVNQPAITGQIDLEAVNTLAVTSSLDKTYNNSNAATENNEDVASNNDTKGSIKGFLRKATRLIEKRTGIDPTTDGELLIGVVAVKLK